MKRILAVCLIITLIVTGCVRPGEPGSSANNPININLNGATLKFLDASAIPDVTGNASKILGNNGTDLIWTTTNGTGNVSTWGDIGGTLANQADLQAALNAKGTSNVTLPIAQGDVTGLSQALTNITTNASNNYTVVLNNSGNITILQGNITSLLTLVNNISGNLSGNYSAWTANDTGLLNRINSVNGSKQDVLVSGTNIKTINGVTILGAGDMTIGGALPDQTGNAGKFLTTNGTTASWDVPTATPGNVTGNFTVSENVSAKNFFATVGLYIQGQLIEPFTAALKSTYDGVVSWLTDLRKAYVDYVPTLNGTVNNHIARNDNPHNVTAQQTGSAPTAGNSSIVTIGNITSGIWSGTAITDLYLASSTYWNSHVQSSSNPHNTTAQQVGAAPTAGNTSLVTGGAMTVTSLTTTGAVNAGSTNITAAMVGALATANVTTIPGVNKTPSTNSSGKLDAWTTKSFIVDLFATNITVTAQNNTRFVTLPSWVNGYNITAVWAGLATNSTSGNVTVNIYNVRLGQYVCTTAISLDVNEGTTKTAAVPAVLSSNLTGLQDYDQLRFDVIYAGTGAKGLQVGVTIATIP